jgi:hypothetical protein
MWWRPVTEPALHRLPSAGRYDKKYRVHGHDHLVVEAYYSDAEEGKPEFGSWMVLDTRFSAMDRHRRGLVFSATYLSDVRGWVKAGGAKLWDPERRKADKDWKPIPEDWSPDDERLRAKRRTPFRPAGVKGSVAYRLAREARQSEPEPGDRQPLPRGLAGKKYAVVPGWITSTSDGQRHWIGFGALTWLYGVNPAECVKVDDETERGWNDDLRAHLIWLYPQRRYEDYQSMREELDRGEDAFKLVEP